MTAEEISYDTMPGALHREGVIQAMQTYAQQQNEGLLNFLREVDFLSIDLTNERILELYKQKCNGIHR